jgi:hypothetical protein
MGDSLGEREKEGTESNQGKARVRQAKAVVNRQSDSQRTEKTYKPHGNPNPD